MNRNNNILLKLSLLLCFIAMGVGIAWAQTTTATLEASTSTTKPEHVYRIASRASNNYMSGITAPVTADNEKGVFAFFAVDGKSSTYRIFSVTQQKWVSYTSEGSYSSKKGFVTVNTDNQQDAKFFYFEKGVSTAGGASADKSGYVISPYKSDGNKQDIYLNWYQGADSNYGQTVGIYGNKWNDAGSVWVLESAAILPNENVTLEFKDKGGNALLSQTVIYTPTSGSPVNLTSSTTTYNFGGVPFVSGQFTISETDKVLEVSYNQTTETLTFKVYDDPNIIKFSSAPSNGQWAQDTRWFTWRNNRDNQANQYNKTFITTSAASVSDVWNLQPILKTMPEDRGSYWCFVGDNSNGFVIQNAAYGPDFVLGINGANVRMLHKGDIPNGYTTTFTAVSNTVIKDGARYAYAFRIGTSGNRHIHVTNGNFTSYDNNGAMTGTGNDTGSSNTITAADPTVFDALQKYDVYTVNWKGATDDFDVNYTDNTKVFGKRGIANKGFYLLLNEGSSITKNDFSSADPTFEVIEVASSVQTGHACKSLLVRLKDAKATDEYGLIIKKPESHNNKEYKIIYDGDEYASGATIYFRPEHVPDAINFDVKGADDCFVWGPVVNTHSKTVTFEVRDRVKTIQTGLYELQLKDQSVIDAVNTYVKPHEGNINTRANQMYLAPTVFSVGNATMKFTGVPNSQIGDETTTFVYIQKVSDTQIAILSLEGYYARSVAFNYSGDQTHTQVPINYTIDAEGYLHIKGWGTAEHPMEGLLQEGGHGASDMKFAMFMPEHAENLYDVYQVQFDGQHTNTRSIRYKGEGFKAYGIAADGGFLILTKNSPVPTKELMSVNKGTGIIKNVEVTGTAQDGQATLLKVTIAEEPVKWQFNIVGNNPNNYKIVYAGKEYESGEIVELPKGTVIKPEDIKTTSDGFVHGPFITEAIDQNDINKVTFQMRSHVTEIAAHKWYAIQLRNKEVTYYNGSQTVTGMLVDAVNGMDSRYKGSYIYMGGNLSGNTAWAFELTGVTTEPTEGLVYVDEVIKDANGDIRVCLMLQNGKYVQSTGQTSDAKTYITLVKNPSSRGVNNDSFIWKSKVMPWKNLYGIPVGLGYSSSNPKEDNIEMYLTEGEIDAFKVIIKDASTNAELPGVIVSYHGDAHVYGKKRFTSGTFRFVEKGNYVELVDGESYNSGAAVLHPDKSKFIARNGYVITNIELTNGDYHDLTIFVEHPTYTNSIIHTIGSYYDDLDQEANLPGTGFIKRGEGLMKYTGNTGLEHTVQNTAVYEIPLYLKQDDIAFEGYEPQGTQDVNGNNARQYQRWYNYDLDGLEEDAATIKLTDIITNLPTTNASYKKTNGYLTGASYGGQFLSPQFVLPSSITEYNVGLDVAFSPATVNAENLNEPTLNMRVIYRIKDAKVIAKAIKDATEANKFYEVHNIMMPNVKKGLREDHTGADVLPLDMDLNNYWMFTTDAETNEALGQVADNASGVHLVVETENNTAGIINAMLIPGSASDNSGGILRASFNTGHFICFQYPGTGSLRQVPADSKATINVYIQNGSNTSGRQRLAQFNLTFISNSEPLIVPEAMASSRSDNEMSSKYILGAQMTFENVHVKASDDAKYSQRYKYPLDFKNSSYGYRAVPWAARSEYNITQLNGMSGPEEYQYTFYPIQAYQNNVAEPGSVSHGASDNDHFLYIDAADQAGKIFNIDLDAQLCTGSRLFCYGWVGCTVGNYGTQHPASVLINVIGYKSNGEEQLISSFNPGMISARGYDKDGKTVYSLIHGRYPAYNRYNKDANTYYAVWQQVGFNFLITDDVSQDVVRYAIQIVNNSYNSNGGDIVLDNFKVYYSSAPAFVDYTTPLCVDETRHVRIHSDFDGLIAKGNINEATVQEAPVTYCFLDADAFDGYTAQKLKDNPIAIAKGYFNAAEITDLDKPLIEYFDVDESSGTHKLKSQYNANTTVKWMLEFAFGESLVGVPVVNNQSGASQKDHGIHSTKFKIPFDQNEEYHYQYSVDDKVYRESLEDGTRRLVMKQPVVRHIDALVAEYKQAGLPIQDHTRDAQGNITTINPNYGKVYSEVQGVGYYFSPRMQAGKQYYLIFQQKSLTNDELNSSTYVGQVATGFFNIEEPCTPIVKFKTPDAMHVITEVNKFYVDDPQANVCVDGKTLFNFNLHDAKVELQKDPETNKMDAHGTPGTPGYHQHTIDDNVLNYIYDWWVGNGTPFAAPHAIGSLGDYAAATSATKTYQYGADEMHDPNKTAGQQVNIKKALEDFRFFYPGFNKHNAMSAAVRIPTTAEWDEVAPHAYNEHTGYSLLQSEINALREFVGEDKNGNEKLDEGEGLGIVILYKQALSLPVDASKYTADGNGIKSRYVTAHPIIPLLEYSVDATLLYCPEPRDVKLVLKEKGVEMYDGFAGMPYPEDMKNVPIRIGLSQVNGAKAKTLRIPVRGLKFAAGTQNTNFLRAQGITEAKPYGDAVFLKETTDTENTTLTVNTPIANLVGGVTTNDETADRYIELKFIDGVNLREGYTYTLTLPFEEDAAFVGSDCNCKNEMDITLKVVPEYQVWTGAAGNTDWTNDQNWARADRSELNAGNAATGDKIDSAATPLDDNTSYISNEANQTSKSFVPMYFTNVLFVKNTDTTPTSVLYKGDNWKEAVRSTANPENNTFIVGLNENGTGATSTPLIKYDMEVGRPNAEGNYACGLFGTYIANGLTFKPGSQLINAQHLTYNKAWVEYELKTDRWYTLASPLQNTFAGEWYSPTDGGKQLTPHFYDINYKTNLNDRFRPAYYQRSWDNGGNKVVYTKSGNNYDYYIAADWSYVYNDVKKEYSNGGFSVMADISHMDNAKKPADNKVLVRLPKADTGYTYYDIDGQTGQKADDALSVTAYRSRLWSDKFKDASEFSQTIANETSGNNFILVGNPFAANMDMDKFFARNTQFEQKYWIMTENGQEVSVKVDGSQWVGTSTDKNVAPLQGFFVKRNDNVNSAVVYFTADMQAAPSATATLKAKGANLSRSAKMLTIKAQYGDITSTAVIALRNGASKGFVTTEDCETFIDSNIADQPTIYTVASGQAMTVNTVPAIDMIPLGILGETGQTVEVTFSGMSGLCLYDSKDNSYTTLYEGTEVTMSAKTTGRYFITSSSPTAIDGVSTDETPVREGIYTLGGQYVGKDVKSLAPGLYIVNGVKMRVK